MLSTAVKERPILYSGPMVNAILRGIKTQTRRVVKLTDGTTGCSAGMACLAGNHATPLRDGIGLVWRPYGGSPEVPMPADRVGDSCPHGNIGDRLWCRETWITGACWYEPDRAGPLDPHDPDFSAYYRADGDLTWKNSRSHIGGFYKKTGWRPSIHMPRWASRLTLEITGVRVQRARDISDADILAEGIAEYAAGLGLDWSTPARRRALWEHLWDGVNGKRDGGKWAWDRNPWTWCITFRRPEGDQP